jgi:carboxyl-terminal processing protease
MVLTTGALLVLLVTVFASGYMLALHVPVEAQDTQPAETDTLFAPFWEAWNLLHENYVDPLDDDKLMQGAIAGMMESLGDPHSSYMDPQVWQQVNESMNGEYEGIGATVRQDETSGGLELVTIMDGSPAQEAGLKPGDVIVEVNGETVIGLTQTEIIALVRGPAGSSVHLGIQRPDTTDMIEFDVTRQRITVPSVVSQVLDNEIGYVRLNQFDYKASQDMRDALEAMDANNLKGLILDMRGNPGGYLTTAIEVASAYITEGPVIIERGPNREQTYNALENAIAFDVPMVVLVDEGSASASELVAGALQDRERATILGTTTFGKGSVQTWRDLSNGGGIRITISRWYTPNGHSVSEVGIEPDITIPYVESATGEDNQITAAVKFLTGGDPFDITAEGADIIR